MRFTRDGAPQASPYSLAGKTGLMAAALAANSVVFAMRAKTDPANSTAKRAPVQVDGLYLAFTTIAAFAAPVTVGRCLGIYKGTTAMLTGETAITPVANWTKDAGGDNGLDTDVARISTTATLAPGTFARSNDAIGFLDLAGFGAAGARVEKYYPFLDSVDGPIVLDPGELLVVSNPVAMDAGGTWQLIVEANYRRRDG